MGYMDMMQKFFANNENNIRPQEIATKWYLKPHAEDAFFEWVSSWSISMRKPSDLGFDNSKHVLPKLITNYHAVKNENNMVLNGQILMFNMVAQTMTEVKTEQKQTIESRCERAIQLKTDVCVYWCHFNQESELLNKLDPEAYEIKGSMNLEHKEDILNGFANGEIKRIITKPRITAFGLNWQHCNHTIYFPNWSYEQYYQAIRRFWRFGQKNEVICDLVYSDGQKRVIDALQLKQDKANDLYNKLNSKTNGKHIESIDKFTTPILKPKFL
jgi:hypothetical protein